MKLNIQKLQSGGGMPFVSYSHSEHKSGIPEQVQSEAKAKGEDEDSEKVSLLSKGVMEELIKTGMPNEVNEFMQELQKVESGSPFTSGFDRNKMYSLTAKASQIINNAKLMQSATTQAYANDGLEELAVGTRGEMYVRDENNKISAISPTDYKENKDKYQPLTVNDLSKARMYDANFSFDTNIISTIQNSIGVNKISDHLIDMIGKLGITSEEMNSYQSKSGLKESFDSAVTSLGGKKPTTTQQQGLKELSEVYQQMGPEGIYNVIKSEKGQQKHLTEAFNYLWSTLPRNAKSVLMARYAVDGTEASNPINIIQMALTTWTDTDKKSTVDYQEAINKAANKEPAAGTTYAQTPLEKLVNGTLNVSNDFLLVNPSKSSYGFRLTGAMSGQLTDANSNLVNPTTLSYALGSGVGMAVNKNKIYFGDKEVKPYEFDQIIYQGGEVINTMIPVNSDGSPNLQLLDSYNDAQNYIKKNNIQSIAEKNAAFKQFGLGFIQLDTTGNLSKISAQYMKPFLVTHGIAPNGIDAGQNNSWSEELEGDELKGNEQLLNNIYTKLKIVYPKAGFFTSNKIVKAPIFMPLNQGAQEDISHIVGHGSRVPQNTLSDDLIREKRNIVYGGSDALNAQ